VLPHGIKSSASFGPSELTRKRALTVLWGFFVDSATGQCQFSAFPKDCVWSHSQFQGKFPCGIFHAEFDESTVRARCDSIHLSIRTGEDGAHEIAPKLPACPSTHRRRAYVRRERDIGNIEEAVRYRIAGSSASCQDTRASLIDSIASHLVAVPGTAATAIQIDTRLITTGYSVGIYDIIIATEVDSVDIQCTKDLVALD
jgi:hypothetical protein